MLPVSPQPQQDAVTVAQMLESNEVFKTLETHQKNHPGLRPNEEHGAKNLGDGLRDKNSKSAMNRKVSGNPRKPNSWDPVLKKNLSTNSVTRLKTRFAFQVKKFQQVAKEMHDKHEVLKRLHRKIVDLRDEILEVNSKERLDVPELNLGPVNRRGDSGDCADLGILHLQDGYNKVVQSLAEANAIKKELNEQLFISEKKCRELQRQLSVERSQKCDATSNIDPMKLQEELEELEKKLAAVDQVNYEKFLAEEQNEKISLINDSLKLELLNVRKKNEELEEELSDLRKVLDSSTIFDQESKPAAGLRVMQKENKSLNEGLSKLRGEYKSLQQSYNELKTEFDLLYLNKDQTSLETTQLGEDLSKAKLEIEKYKRESECFQNELKIEIREKADLLAILNKLKGRLNNEITGNSRTYLSKSNKRKSEDDVSIITTQFKALQEEIERLQIEIESKEDEYELQLKLFEQKTHEYVNETKNLHSTIERFHRNKEKLESEVKCLKSRLMEYEGRLRECRCVELKRDLKRQSRSILAFNKKLKAISYKYQFLKEELQRIQKAKEISKRIKADKVRFGT